MLHSHPWLIVGSALLAAVFAGSCSNNADAPPPYRCLDKCMQGSTLGGSGAGVSSGGTRTGGRSGGSSGAAGLTAQAGSGGSGASPGSGGVGQPLSSGGNAQGGSNGLGGDAAAGAAGAPTTCTASPNCAAYCHIVATGCGQSYETCVCTCEAGAQSACPDKLTALLACAGTSPQVTCAPFALVQTCEQQGLDLIACKADSQGNLCAKNTPACNGYCAGQFVAMCQHGPESYTGCLCDCETRVAPGCPNEFSAYAQCALSAPSFGCTAQGTPEPTICSGEWDTLRACQILK